MIDFEQPAWLALLPLALLPVWWHGQRLQPWPCLDALPVDRWSAWLDHMLRACGVIVVLATLLGVAGPGVTGRSRERVGRGAHIAIALDRSASMADGFAGAQARMGESKGAAAARLLERFVAGRPLDLFGVTNFSTAPLHALPLTADHTAVRAAIAAAAAPGVGLTNVAAGLALALGQFDGRPRTGARVILLVSDGAAHIDPRAEAQIRRMFSQYGAELYWIFLRTEGGASPSRPPAPEDGAEASPEFQLDTLFRDMGVPYRLYEVDDPRALERAVDDVSRLQNLPLRYSESVPRQELSSVAYLVALFCLALLLVARHLELTGW